MKTPSMKWKGVNNQPWYDLRQYEFRFRFGQKGRAMTEHKLMKAANNPS
jgi:hypothetical protein